MPFTDNGYNVRRFRDIQRDIRRDLESGLGTPVSSSPDSVLGITNSVFSNEVGRVENNIQALVSNLSIFTAEGVFLDELVRYIGLERRRASPANGSLKVWRDSLGAIPQSVRFATDTGIEFIVPGGLLHTLDECAEATLIPATYADAKTYTLILNDTTFEYTTTSGDTITDVVDYFATEITSQLGIESSNVDDNLQIVSDNENLNGLDITTEDFGVEEIAIFAFAESAEVGELDVQENTITNIVSNLPSLLRVTNPLPFEQGLDLETDEELRARHQLSVQLGGNATVPSITARLLQVAGVTQVNIVENTALVEDVDGRPPKSYETVVVGGDPSLIGQQIWESKPAGVETFGEISTVVTDDSGENKAVNWSRPENIYIFIRVTYKKYDEEEFPTNAESTMTDALLDYGNSLSVGNDVIPTRFIGPLYRAITGLDTVQVEIAGTSNIGDDFADITLAEDTIPIDVTQIGVFTESRIELVEDV